MLEHVPAALGQALQGRRAGLDAVAARREAAAVPDSIRVTSSAFADGAPMPARFTADGPGLSPPLAWDGVPAGTGSILVLVQDADSPTPQPLVHLIAADLPATDGHLDEGALPSPAGQGTEAGPALGRNSFLKRGWLPPDPPTGHGPHRYVFQVYALPAAPEPVPGGRGAALDLVGHAIAKGMLTAIYERPA